MAGSNANDEKLREFLKARLPDVPIPGETRKADSHGKGDAPDWADEIIPKPKTKQPDPDDEVTDEDTGDDPDPDTQDDQEDDDSQEEDEEQDEGEEEPDTDHDPEPDSELSDLERLKEKLYTLEGRIAEKDSYRDKKLAEQQAAHDAELARIKAEKDANLERDLWQSAVQEVAADYGNNVPRLVSKEEVEEWKEADWEESEIRQEIRLRKSAYDQYEVAVRREFNRKRREADESKFKSHIDNALQDDLVQNDIITSDEIQRVADRAGRGDYDPSTVFAALAFYEKVKGTAIAGKKIVAKTNGEKRKLSEVAKARSAGSTQPRKKTKTPPKTRTVIGPRGNITQGKAVSSWSDMFGE